MPTSNADLERYRLHAELCKVLTDPKRLALLDALRSGDRSVGDLAEAIGATLANTSQHLRPHALGRAGGGPPGRHDGSLPHRRARDHGRLRHRSRDRGAAACPRNGCRGPRGRGPDRRADRLSDSVPACCPLLALLVDGVSACSHGAAWTLLSGLAFGLVTAIIPNPVFARQIPPSPSPSAVAGIRTAHGPRDGDVHRTRRRPRPGHDRARSARPGRGRGPVDDPRRLAGFGAFLAIGCPVCNKVALVLLGTSGAMSVYAPIQPLIGAVSLALLVVTAAWRLRLRATGDACPA